MSLLRPCLQAASKPTRAVLVASRAFSEKHDAPTEVTRQSSDIIPSPVRDVVTADIVSGAPAELRHRTVRIFQPTRSTTQSGPARGKRWRIDWDILPGGGRWENPLMGWASSADYMQGTRIGFRSKEDAIHFAEKQGWDYYVQDSEVKRIPPKNYAENYLYRPTKLRLVRTK